jgi:DNA polymerase elongation subunit (family B)
MQISNNSKKELVVNGGDTMTRYALQLGTVLGASEESNTLILSDTTPCDVFSNCAEKPASTTCICFPYDESSSDSRNNAEQSLLLEFVRLLAEYGPHVIVTYNGNAFDTPYILKRADVLGIGGVVRKKLSWGSSERRGVRQLVQQKWDKCEALGLVSIGRGAAFAPDALVCIEKEVTTTAFGTQIRKNVVIPGKVNFDLMCWWKLNVQESYYTLGGLSQKYIKRSKKDLPYHLLPFRFKTPEGRLEIVEYCVMDTVLTMYLASLKVAIVMFMSMSYVQMVDISQKFQSGQGYCALSMLIREINERVKGGGLPYAIPENATLSEEIDLMESAEDDADGDEEEAYETIKSKGASDKVGYQGATVLESVSGIYDDCIACCDFASLYPSIMMAHNLSYETHLEKIPDGWEGQSVRPDPRGFDGWELGDAKARTKPDKYDYQIMRNGQRFVAKKHHVGLLASIVEKLIQARKAVRAQMKKETSDSILVALEQRQLSIKYAANSVYGAAGARKGKLPSATFIAETVTNEGRAMIDTIKFVAENIYLCNGVEILHRDSIPSTDDPSKWFNMQVIYGDTVRSTGRSFSFHISE